MRSLPSPLLALLILCPAHFAPAAPKHEEAVYRSPIDVAFSPSQKRLIVADRTARALRIGDSDANEFGESIQLPGLPSSLQLSPEGALCYVALEDPDLVVQVDWVNRRIAHQWEISGRPAGMTFSPKHHYLLVGLAASHEVAVLDTALGRVVKRIPVLREPRWLSVTPDQDTVLVVNFLPAESLRDPRIAASVSLINVSDLTVETSIRLPIGSTLARGVVVSPDGRWVYVAHVLARFAVPASQLDRAWISSNALTILDLVERKVYATLLLDQIMNGAAEPWDVALSEDGSTAWVSLAGVHEVARIDLSRVHGLLDGSLPPPKGSPTRPNLWQQIAADTTARERLGDDLDALTQARALRRFKIQGRGPRGLDYSEPTRRLAVTTYFTGEVQLLDPESGRSVNTISLGPQPPPDSVRRGEAIFHDATYSMQHWLSCSTCHPEGRVDALNWDLMNDGITNPKNTKSLVWAHLTPPSMARAVRANMETAALAGFRYTQNIEPQRQDVEAVYAYLRSLNPQPLWQVESPDYDKSLRNLGRKIFERDDVGCAQCHPAPLFTDLKSHDVGTGRVSEAGAAFDTPTLRESWRTAPYLHHGLAVSLEEVLTRFNPDDRHGTTSQLSNDQLRALAHYLRTL